MSLKVGCQLHPQATTVAALRDAWCRADALGADSIWVWDHILLGDPAKAKAKLGWEPKTTLEEMICEMVDADIERHKAQRAAVLA